MQGETSQASEAASASAPGGNLPPTVAVVIPVYNRERIIIETLETVRAQTRPPARVVVVDDGSTDATVRVVNDWAASAAPPFEVRVLKQANKGAAAARNLGAEDARGCDCLAFLDSDDLWPPDFLERTTAALAADPSLVAASVPRQIKDVATGQWLDAPKPPAWDTNGFFTTAIPMPSATLLRADAFHRAGQYSAGLRIRNDLDFHLRLSLQGRWTPLPGDPITMRRGTTALGGPPHLTDGFESVEHRLVKVHVLDRFVNLHQGAKAMNPRAWRKQLANRWLKVGRMLYRDRRRAEAAWCFRRALRYRKSSFNTWFWAVVTAASRPVAPVNDYLPREWGVTGPA